MPVPDLPDAARLKRGSANAAAVSLGAQMAKFILQSLYQVLLARLLLPTDFGLVAMVAPLVTFVQLLADLGMSQAIIQRDTIGQPQLTLLFWANAAAGLLLGGVVLASASAIEAFYAEPRVFGIALASAALFFTNGLFGVHLALLNRNLAFGKLAMVDIGAFLVGAVSGLLAAWGGLGYWAVLASQFGASISTLVLSWLLCRWRPGRPALTGEWRGLLGFGANVTSFNLVNFFSRNLDNILIGYAHGEAQLGLYDRAYKLLLLPLSQITAPFARVVLPLLSRVQHDPATYRAVYRRFLEAVLLLTYPGVLFAIILHERLVQLALGDAWAAVGPIFAVLGIGALFAPISNSTGWLFISQNRTREMRNWGIVSSALFVGSFLIGLPYGPLGVASCYIAVGCLQGPLVWWAAGRSGPVGLPTILRIVWPFAAAAAACSGAVHLWARLAPANPAALGGALCVAYAVFVATLAALPQGRGIVREMWRQSAAICSRIAAYRTRDAVAG